MISQSATFESRVVISFAEMISITVFSFGFAINESAQNPDIDLLKKINNWDIPSGTYESIHFITVEVLS